MAPLPCSPSHLSLLCPDQLWCSHPSLPKHGSQPNLQSKWHIFLWSSSFIKLMSKQWDYKLCKPSEIQAFLRSTSHNPFPCLLSQLALVGLNSFLLKPEWQSAELHLWLVTHSPDLIQAVYLHRQKHDLSQQVSRETKAEALWAHSKIQGLLNKVSNQGSPTHAFCATQDDSKLWEWWHVGTGCPEKLWMSPSLYAFKARLDRAWNTCPCQGVGTRCSLRPLPT